ncbi:DNA-binding domain-containing protein [Bacteroides sp. GD17]|jgi:hypothetical protein|uniref:DNA-binding domain-containing protein n=1 Tax=Bacteroides sp. GD17 TaxID=3139826 RepID=UPI0025F20481|nr:DNA-binding domain-containing protein [uncultured Bacteroides sp.]
MAKNLLKVWMADNTVTTDDKTDKIFVLESTRSVDQQFVLDRMADKNPGLHRETMSASVNLYHEVLSELVMNGYSVNTDLFRAVPQIKGLAEGNVWNPEKNSIYVSLTQGKKLREAIKDTTVQILGDRQAAIYINGTQDAATRATNLSATAGRNFTVLGKNIKVAGSDPSVGITLTAAEGGQVTKLGADMLVVNDPSKLIVLLPSGLKDGEYTLTVTTQYTPGKTLLKTPRHALQTIYIGEAPAGGGSSSGGDSGSGSDGDQSENPLG